MTRENIIDKIKKLSAHEASARKVGSIAEAELFAAKVNELLIAHKLEMDEVHAESQEEDTIGTECFDPHDYGLERSCKRCTWQSMLAHCIAEYHFCKIMVVVGSNAIYFVGRKEDRQCALYLFGYLAKLTKQTCQREYDKIYNKLYAVGEHHLMTGWKEAFYFGTVKALNKRFADIREEQKYRASAGQFALVLKKSEEELKAFVDDKTTGSVTNKAPTELNGHGFKCGQDHGASVSLNTAIETNHPVAVISGKTL